VTGDEFKEEGYCAVVGAVRECRFLVIAACPLPRAAGPGIRRLVQGTAPGYARTKAPLTAGTRHAARRGPTGRPRTTPGPGVSMPNPPLRRGS